MTTKLATITFKNGKQLYTKFSTTSDYASPDLFLTQELCVRADAGQDVELVEIQVNGYDSWIGIVKGNVLLAPLTPFSQEFEDKVEGVEEDGLIHLRALHGCGPAWCGYEFKHPRDVTKYVFTDAYDCTDGLKERTVLNKSVYALAKDGQVCMACALHEDVKNLMNT